MIESKRGLSSLETTRTTFGSAAHLVRPPRRVTPCDDDPGGRIVARDSADGLPRALIRCRGHRARVDEDEVGLLGRRPELAPRASRSSSKPSVSA